MTACYQLSQEVVRGLVNACEKSLILYKSSDTDQKIILISTAVLLSFAIIYKCFFSDAYYAREGNFKKSEIDTLGDTTICDQELTSGEFSSIQLINHKNSLCWQLKLTDSTNIYNIYRKPCSKTAFEIVASDNCSKETLDFIASARKSSIKALSSKLYRFGIEGFVFDSTLKKVVLKIASLKSILNQDISISYNFSTVTLVTTNECCWYKHAQIIVESLDKEPLTGETKHKVFVGHLTDEPVTLKDGTKKPGKVKSGMLPILNYHNKSKVFKVHRLVAEKLIKAIEKQEYCPFSYLGRYGYRSSDKHNCITWAAEQLELIGIKVDFDFLTRIVAIPSMYVTNVSCRPEIIVEDNTL